MKTALIRLLVFGSIPLGGIGALLIILGLQASTTNPITHAITHVTNPVLFVSGMCLAIIAGLLFGTAWIGALFATVRRQDWTWVLLLAVLQGPATVVYSVVGPA